MINSIDSLGIPKNWRKSLNILQNIKNPKESQTPEREQMKKEAFQEIQWIPISLEVKVQAHINLKALGGLLPLRPWPFGSVTLQIEWLIAIVLAVLFLLHNITVVYPSARSNIPEQNILVVGSVTRCSKRDFSYWPPAVWMDEWMACGHKRWVLYWGNCVAFIGLCVVTCSFTPAKTHFPSWCIVSVRQLCFLEKMDSSFFTYCPPPHD